MEITNYSRIEIGECDSNIKIIFFRTKLNISNKFLTFPFGSKRIKFQYPEMFSYILEKQNDNYKLQIIRNKKINCKSTKCMFGKNGWKFNLIISNIPTFDFINDNILYQLLPNNYATFSTNIKTPFTPKIGIVVPFYNRHKYVKQFLESIYLSNIENILFIMIDESLTNSNDDDRTKTNELVKNFQNEKFHIIKIYKNKHGNMNDSILTGFDIMLSLNTIEYFITIDSDTIIKPNWINKLVETYETLMYDFPNKYILLSGFNTLNASHNELYKKENYIIKQSVGGCNLMCKKELFYLLRYCFHSHKWDTNISNQISNHNGIIATTNPSVVEHIGILSTNGKNNPTKSCDFN